MHTITITLTTMMIIMTAYGILKKVHIARVNLVIFKGSIRYKLKLVINFGNTPRQRTGTESATSTLLISVY